MAEASQARRNTSNTVAVTAAALGSAAAARATFSWLSNARGAAAGVQGVQSQVPPHPGTPAGRQKAWNPQIPPNEFEHRFIATAPRLLSKKWDFIVVGAGSAGCVLASRLSQDPKVSVLLIEGGGEAQNASIIKDPRKATSLVGCEADWGFRSTPQPQLLPEGRAVEIERGKGLGGSSTLNYSMWVRGAPEDFDRWSTECGCGEDWSYAGVLPHFKAIECMLPGATSSSTSITSTAGRGEEGEMTARVLWPPLPEVEAFKESANAIGIGTTMDYNGPNGQAGVAETQHSVNAAHNRADAFNTFVEPYLRSRSNLCVASEGFVRRVLFDKTRCVGVEVQLGDGSFIDVHTSYEVILSAGALQSPQLLMLSGIGDARKLQELEIPIVADVPSVGQNLQDHPLLVVPFEVPENQYEEFAKGAPAGCSGLNGVAFWKSRVDEGRDQLRGNSSGCDIEFVLSSRLSNGLFIKILLNQFEQLFGGGVRSGKRPWAEKVAIKLARSLMGTAAVKEKIGRTISFAIEYNHPMSRGSVTLQSANPLDPPLVDVAWVREPTDLDALVEALKKARCIMQAPPFSRFVGDMPKLPGIHTGLLNSGGLESFWSATDAQLRTFALNTVATTWHYSCTARMGAADAPLTEVALDPRLRVRCVSGLRIADQSVTPFVVSANTNASSMMIGSKAAQIINEDYGLGQFRQARSAL